MAEYKSQQINRGSISDILQLIEGFSSGHERNRNKFISHSTQFNSVTTLDELNNIIPTIKEHNEAAELSGNSEYIINIDGKYQEFKNSQNAFSQAEEILQQNSGNPDALMEDIMGQSWGETAEAINRIDTLNDVILTGAGSGYKYKTSKDRPQYSSKSLINALNKRKGALLSKNHIWKENEGAFTITNPDGTIDETAKGIWDDMQYYIISGDYEGVQRKLQEGINHSSKQFKYNENIYSKYLEIQQKIGPNNTSALSYADITESYRDNGATGIQLWGDDATSSKTIHPLYVQQRLNNAMETGDKFNQEHLVLTGGLYDENPLWKIGDEIHTIGGFNPDDGAEATTDSNNKISPEGVDLGTSIFQDNEVVIDDKSSSDVITDKNVEEIHPYLADYEKVQFKDKNSREFKLYQNDPEFYLEDDLSQWITHADTTDGDFSNEITIRENALRGYRDNMQIEARENTPDGGGVNWGGIAATGIGVTALASKDQIAKVSNTIYKSGVQASKYLHSSYKMPYEVQMRIYQDKTVKEFFKVINPMEEKLSTLTKGSESYKKLLDRIASKKTGIIDYLLGKNIKYTPKVGATFAEQISGRSPIQGLNMKAKDLARMFSTKELQKWNLFKVKDAYFNKLPNTVKHTLTSAARSKGASIAGGFFQYRVGQGITDAMGLDSVTGKGFFREAATDVAATSGAIYTLRKVLGTQIGRRMLGKFLVGVGKKKLGSTIAAGTTGVGAPAAVIMAVVGAGLTAIDLYKWLNSSEVQKSIQEEK